MQEAFTTVSSHFMYVVICECSEPKGLPPVCHPSFLTLMSLLELLNGSVDLRALLSEFAAVCSALYVHDIHVRTLHACT